MSPEAPARRTNPLRWLIGPFVALLALAGLAVGNRGPEWRVTLSSGQGFEADGRPVPAADGEAVRRALRSAHHLSTDDSTTITLTLGNIIAVDVAPGSRIGCPGSPGRFMDTEIGLTVIDGSIRILRGPGFGGRRLVAFTPEARLEIDAPLISLHRADSTSRVDVYDGVVRVGGRSGGAPLVVAAGKSAVIPAGEPPRSAGDVNPDERRRLASMIGRPFPGS